jgi:hypothetical protein
MMQEKQKSKEIYIVFIITDTNIGKMIRFFTNNQYSHVTLSFDQSLQMMYSFARYRINSPILGGFVEEQPRRYLTGNKDVTVKVCKLLISQEDYIRIQKKLEYFKEHREEMIYNTLNAVLSLLRLKVPLKNTYTCLEFVTYLLELKDIMTIRELEQELKHYVTYQGGLKEIANIEPVPEDEFFQRRNFLGIVSDTAIHFKRVIVRAFGY